MKRQMEGIFNAAAPRWSESRVVEINLSFPAEVF